MASFNNTGHTVVAPAPIVLTGANGFVGSDLIRHLCLMGFEVRACARKKIDLTDYSFQQFNYNGIDGDTQWQQVLQGAQAVVHAAARVHILKEAALNPLAEFRKVNVKGTLRLARTAAEAGVKRFIFLSSIGVNGATTVVEEPFTEMHQPKPQNAYALSKWEAEQGLQKIAAETGLEVVVIRPPLVYGFSAPGNFGSLVRAVQRGWPLPLGAVHNQRSLVALDNLVDFIVTCITHPQAANHTFLVSDGQDLSTTELLRGMAQEAGVSARLLPVPVWALQVGASLLGKGDVVQRLCGNLQVDISKARSLLGWVPPVSVEEGLRRAMVV
jgi:nucleoside-diphosphate-sugar epimerase